MLSFKGGSTLDWKSARKAATSIMGDLRLKFIPGVKAASSRYQLYLKSNLNTIFRLNKGGTTGIKLSSLADESFFKAFLVGGEASN